MEGALAWVASVGDTFAVGLDSRIRGAVRGGEEEGEGEFEGEEEEAEREQRWDARAGAVATASAGSIGGFLFAGAQAVALREGETRAAGLVSLGIQLVR